jgi:tetratricopeptide (TPR) repeat protein
MVEYFRALSSRYTLGFSVLGSRRSARQMVLRAVNGQGLFATAARFSLAFMMKEDREHAQAESVCQSLLRDYPDNRSALRTMRDNYLKAGRFAETIKVGRTVDRLIRASFPNNLYGLSENWTVTAKAWQGLAVPDSAKKYADSVLAHEPLADEVPWLKTYLREARTIRDH